MDDGGYRATRIAEPTDPRHIRHQTAGNPLAAKHRKNYDMAMNDPIADMLTRIRNATRNHAKDCVVLNSKVCRGIASILQSEGYIEGFDVIEDGRQGQIRIRLKYGSRGETIINRIERVSKVGCRVYRKVDELDRPLQGLGISIVSTSSGVLSDRQCREQKVSGEVLAVVH